MEKKNETARR